MDQKEVILQRIKKLKTHAESAKQMGSLEEAETFMLKAIELANEYNISMIEVDATEIKQSNEFKNWGYGEAVSYDDSRYGDKWKYELMDVIVDYNYCSFTFRKSRKIITVYGNMENVDTCIWLYNFMQIGLFNIAEAKYQEERKAGHVEARTGAYNYKRDFMIGAIDGIRTELREQRIANNKVTDLVMYNDKQLSTFLKTTKPNLGHATPPKEVKTGAGYSHGYEAGLNFNITKSLTNKSSKPLTNKSSKH